MNSIRGYKLSPDYYTVDDDGVEMCYHDMNYGSWEECFPIHYMWSSDEAITAYDQQSRLEEELRQQREDEERAEKNTK